MSKAGLIAVASGALWTAAPAEAGDRYKPQELFDRKGYTEKRLGERLWVRTTVKDMSSAENAQQMALYRRGARPAGGIRIFPGARRQGLDGLFGRGKRMKVHAHGAELKVRGVRTWKDQAPCEMKGGMCPVFGTDHVLARLGPLFAGQP